VLRHCEKYDIANNSWKVIAEMQEKRCTTTSIAHGNSLYVLGGYHGNGRLKTIEKYDTKTDNWSVISLKLAVSIEAGLSFVLPNNQVAYVAGKDDGKASNNITIYDLDNNTQIS